VKNFQFTFTARFQKHFAELTMREKKQFRQKLELLSGNPFHPSLRLKRIQGTEKLYEFSVNMDLRVIWYYENEDLITLVDIGHHDILKKY